jgi:hypothetical protein
MLNTRSSLGGTLLVALIVATSPAAVQGQSSIAATAFVQGSYYVGDDVPERGKRPFVNGGVTFLFESIALLFR